MKKNQQPNTVETPDERMEFVSFLNIAYLREFDHRILAMLDGLMLRGVTANQAAHVIASIYGASCNQPNR
jgi:hypothetical protein